MIGTYYEENGTRHPIYRTLVEMPMRSTLLEYQKIISFPMDSSIEIINVGGYLEKHSSSPSSFSVDFFPFKDSNYQGTIGFGNKDGEKMACVWCSYLTIFTNTIGIFWVDFIDGSEVL